jgi:membrane protein DedA with SNARE-associated domain
MLGMEFFYGLVYTFGYFGVFFSAFLGSATLFLPTPALLVVFFAGPVLDPLLVGIIAGFGAAVGELIGYGIGYGVNFGSRLFRKKNYRSIKKTSDWKKWGKKGEKWFNKYGGFLLTFIFALTPLPDDVIGLIAGYVKYDIKKYFIACLIGKIILCTAIAYAGYYGIDLFIEYFL